MNNKVRWGILGAAGIAYKAILPALKVSEFAEAAAIASRNSNKAVTIAEEFGVSQVYEDYASLLKDPNIDAVYIPLPNTLHAEWTIIAAEHGKHVLCEKPAALTATEVRRMTEACERNGVLFAEAFMYQHHPRYERIREILANQEIGVIRSIQARFTYNKTGQTDNIRFQSEVGGGALYDVGCYPIHAARLLLGTEPVAVTCNSSFFAEDSGVDIMTSGLIEFPDGISLTFDCGMLAEPRNHLEIVGDKGRIEIPDAFNCSPHSSEIRIRLNKELELESFGPADHYELQINDFSKKILSGNPLEYQTNDAMLNAAVVEACAISMKSGLKTFVQS
ncbi:gfo/Idh/MocA family oxidoreductase [Paenibacillus psychroresistens]|uniref:Gfo/Idh/MocA family oxidoreductase n=1 Tax=Paenibacillus psychroresistens TaxID=1778678 RepID=A0A6B8RQS0_9BACL|nr:Gfo/Idh/MocA family oxidoreductase [Paenibacillus psychroresistens]QGQ98187.1 gfo/Idh/MocA family oxidoreductase [Paenibacillus psychroresistens]